MMIIDISYTSETLLFEVFYRIMIDVVMDFVYNQIIRYTICKDDYC